MHPAPSVIIFTSLSGLGFGLMFWLGLGMPAVSGPLVVSVFAVLALGLAVIGLLASTFHLGNPQRALRAFTQWRTSWLSREGILAVLTLFTFFGYACVWAFLDMRIAALGWVSSALAMMAEVPGLVVSIGLSLCIDVLVGEGIRMYVMPSFLVNIR